MSDTSLCVGFTDWIGYAPFFLAQGLGYFNETDIRLERRIPSEERELRFNKGSIDCIGISLAAQCKRVKVIADQASTGVKVMDEVGVIVMPVVQVAPPGTERIVAKKCFCSLADLATASIAYKPGSLEQWYWHYYCACLDTTVPDKVIAVQSRQAMYNSLVIGEADAAIMYEPIISSFMKEHGDQYHILDVNVDYSDIMAVLLVREDAMTGKQRLVRVLIDGYLRAVDYFKTSTDQALDTLMGYYCVNNYNARGSLKERLLGIEWPGRTDLSRLYTNGGLSHPLRTTISIWNNVFNGTGIDDTAIRVDDSLFAVVSSGLADGELALTIGSQDNQGLAV